MKFSLISQNNTPVAADHIVGVSAGGVDQKTTWQKAAELIATLLPNGSIKQAMLDFTNFDVYSATETDTGRKWVDGRTIYRKVLRGQVTLANGTVNLAHGISGLTLAWEALRVTGGLKYSATSNSGSQIILNNHREAAGNWNNLDSMDQTNLSWVGSFAWGSSYYMLVLEYVK